MSVRLIHITPQLPPNIGGVGDYAVILGRRLAERTGGRLASAYVQAGGGDSEVPADTLDSVDLAGRQSAEALTQAVGAYAEGAERAAVLLHYVGYGYQRRGCPRWLVRALRHLRTDRPSVRLCSVFHEVYATSRKPWTSAFWLSPLQRHRAVQIAHLSDAIITNRAGAAEKLGAMTDEATPIHVSPTFSNVGEPEMLPPYAERELYAVVFGGATAKAHIYERHGAALGRALRRMGIERVVDIGTPVRSRAADELGLPVEAVGVQPAEEVSAHLRRASIGILRYSLHCLTKSGIWAGYAAHGVPPLLLTVGEWQPAGMLAEDRHFVLLDALNSRVLGAGQRAAMSREVKRWYDERGHSKWATQAVLNLLAVGDCESELHAGSSASPGI